MSKAPDHYKVLQVDPEADAEVITAAYRALARRLHPDRDITGVDEFRMSELNRAYGVLRDAKKREQYDAIRILMEPMGPGEETNGQAPAPRSGGLAARWQAHESAAAAGANGAGQGPEDGPGETLLPFGRYAGMSLRQVAAKDAEYLRWLGRHSSGLRYRREIERILKESLDNSYSPRPSR